MAWDFAIGPTVSPLRKVETTFKVQLVVSALDDTLVEFGIDDSQVRPVLGRRL